MPGQTLIALMERSVERFADEIYLLAQEVAGDPRFGAVPSGSYERSVRLATEHLLRALPIPPFETWVVAYREDPERFDQEMLGLWRSGISSPDAPEPDERRPNSSASDEEPDPDLPS